MSVDWETYCPAVANPELDDYLERAIYLYGVAKQRMTLALDDVCYDRVAREQQQIDGLLNEAQERANDFSARIRHRVERKLARLDQIRMDVPPSIEP